VTYKTGFGLDVWIYCTLYIHNSGLQGIQRYCYSTHFPVHRCTRIRILSLHLSYPGNGFITVSLSFQITHEVFFSQSNSFLAITLQPPIPTTRLNSIPLLPSSHPGRLASRNSTRLDSTRLDSIQFLCCQAHILAGWRLETRLDSTTASFGTLPYNHFARITWKTQPVLLGRRVYSAVA
jgi:hypothetical protein